MSDYQYKQYVEATKGHNENYNISIKIFGSKNNSNQFDLTTEQQCKIREILKNE